MCAAHCIGLTKKGGGGDLFFFAISYNTEKLVKYIYRERSLLEEIVKKLTCPFAVSFYMEV